jgi:hypothetical protein
MHDPNRESQRRIGTSKSIHFITRLMLRISLCKAINSARIKIRFRAYDYFLAFVPDILNVS